MARVASCGKALHFAGLVSLAYVFITALVGTGGGGGGSFFSLAPTPGPTPSGTASPSAAATPSAAPSPSSERTPRVVVMEGSVRVVQASPLVVVASPNVVVVESSPRVVLQQASPHVVYLHRAPGADDSSSGGGGNMRAVTPFLSLQEQSARLYTPEGHSFGAAYGLPEEGLAPLTRWTQDFIYQHQHPSPGACAAASFLRSDHYHSGLGSQLHVAGLQLAAAIGDGRVWYWADNAGGPYAQPAICGTELNWHCYFKRPTNCTAPPGANIAVGIDPADGRSDKNYVPPVVKARLAEVAPHMTFDEVKYWWRAQSVAYIMRFNDKTVAALAALRRADKMVKVDPASAPGAAALRALPAPLFPLPAGTVSAHIRHGDKGKEMVLQPFSKFLAAAEALVKLNPFSLRRAIFLTTEDGGCVAEAAGNQQGWTALYSDIPRHNSNGWEQMALANNIVHMHFVQVSRSSSLSFLSLCAVFLRARIFAAYFGVSSSSSSPLRCYCCAAADGAGVRRVGGHAGQQVSVPACVRVCVRVTGINWRALTPSLPLLRPLSFFPLQLESSHR